MIDTLFFDLDGTLIDLNFEDQFWNHHLPNYYALQKNIPLKTAQQFIQKSIQALSGSLNWYCIDFWDQHLTLDVLKPAQQLIHLLQFRSQVQTTLLSLQKTACQTAIITNAHPRNFKLKDEVLQLSTYVDFVVSSHDLEHPKETQSFWKKLNQSHPFNPKTTLFIDDNLAVLQSAQLYGIENLRWIAQPNHQQASRINDQFTTLDTFSDLLNFNLKPSL